MSDFGRLFLASGGGPIPYNGKTLLQQDTIPAMLGERFTVTIESTDSPYPQGVQIGEGVMLFGNRSRRVVVWESESLPAAERESSRSRLPFRFEVVCGSRRGFLTLRNATDFGGRPPWWLTGACMIVEEIPGGRRYRCNDLEPDEDFDDLVFSVVRSGSGTWI